MKKYIFLGIIVIASIIVLIIPINRSKNEKGLIIYNMDKSIVFFVPIDSATSNYCQGAIGLTRELKGFQFKRTLENYNQFFTPPCKIVTSKPGDEYGLSVRTWYIGKCDVKFSYNESVIGSVLSRLHYENFSMEVDGKLFIKFKYIVKTNLSNMQFKEIK